MTMNLLKE